MMIRLDKFLANMNVGSRSQVHEIIKHGHVTVNGKTCRTAKEKIGEKDFVEVDGKKIIYQEYHYFMMNKPKGVLTATEDSDQKTVLDLISLKDRYKNLSPVGRLDKDTTGLLLLTNDGQLNHHLLAPDFHVAKVYKSLIAGIVTQEEIIKFKNGIVLKDGTKLKSAVLKILNTDLKNKQSIVEITIIEGKYHQIKRMFGSVGMKVLELERLQMGKLILDSNLKLGDYRELTSKEVALLKK